ncbi:MAG: hypothetical protein CL609_09635 [Anaerolineaceae bacterium]|nr:hypothetical protein [Anaerolineaceae bacterium]
MNFGPEFLLGLIIAGFGGVLWLAARFMLRTFQDSNPTQITPPIDLSTELDTHNRPVILVTKGGQVRAINQAAKQLFNIEMQGQPNLEALARRVRPTDVFYSICSEPSETTVTIEGQVVEALSYPVTEGMLIVFQGRSFGAVATQPHSVTTKTLVTINEMTHLMAASLDLEETIQAILENIFKIVPADVVELSIWDDQHLELTPYRQVKEGNLAGELVKAKESYQRGQGFAGHILVNRQPLFIPDIRNFHEVQPVIDLNRFPILAYMGFPLIVGKEVIGTLELGSYTKNAFTSDDRQILLMVCGPAAIAVHNSVLFLNEQKRSAELSGLAKLAQSFSATRDPQKLFEQILESIKKLIPVEMLGFLLYNENTHMLEAQVPFQGLPDPFVDIYKTEITPGSYAEKLLVAQDILMTENAAVDEHWQNLGLDHLARAASIRDSVLVPLTSGGVVLGFLQAANHQNGESFSQAEMHLLMIIANQAAPVIENTTLVLQSRQRTQRAEVLRRIASLASSSVPVDEVLTFSLRELAQLLRAQVGVIFLMNRERSMLTLHTGSVYGNIEQSLKQERLLSDDAQFPFTMTGSQRTLVIGEFDDTKPLVPFYQQVMETWHIQSAVVVPLIVRNEGIGELWLGNTAPNFYDQGDVQVIIPAASQIAAVVEQSNLFGQTDESLRKRVEQLTALARISRELSTSLDLSYLLKRVYEEAIEMTHADSGGLILFEMGQEPDDQEPAIHSVLGDTVPAAFSAFELELIKEGQPVLINDTSEEKRVSFPNRIHSAILVPVNYKQKPAAFITLYHRNQNHFSQADLEIMQSLAAQAAVAFGNAWQYQDQIQRSEILKRELDTQEKFFQISDVLRPEQPFNVALDAIGQAIIDVTPFSAVLISVYDPEEKVLKRVSGRGLPQETWYKLKEQTQSWSAVQDLLKEEFRHDVVYFIPNDKMPVKPANVHLISIMESQEVTDELRWHPDDLCLIPLSDLDGNPLGLISVDAPEDGLRPDRLSFDALELFAVQTSLLLENQRYHASLEKQVELLQEENTQAGVSMATQQRRILSAVQGQLNRFSAGLDLSAKASRQADRAMVLSALANDLITQFGFSNVIAAEQHGTSTPVLTAVFGDTTEDTQFEALLGQRNPLREVLENRSNIWVKNLESDSTWQKSALLKAAQAVGFLAMAFPISEHLVVGILAITQEPLIFQDDQEIEIFTRLMNQIGIVLQNQTLLTETRQHLGEVDLLLKFSRKLGSLDSIAIMTTLLDTSFDLVPNAEAGWAAFWDNQNQVLVPIAAAGYNKPEELLKIRITPETKTLPFKVFTDKQSIRVDEVDFAESYPLSSGDLMHYRQSHGARLPISNLVVPVVIAEQSLGVMVLENFEEPVAFDQEDENLASSLAQQTALALENARLFRASQQRSQQLQALTEVGSTITSSLQSEALINSLLDRLGSVVSYDTATLWLRENDKLTVVAAKGFADDEDRAGISVSIEDSALFQQMNADLLPIFVPDIRKDDRFPSLLEPERLSWLGIPLLSKSTLVGMIALEKQEASYYQADGVQIATTFASQAAVALENARLFEESVRRTMELDQRSQRLALLNRFSGEVTATLDESHILELSIEQILQAVDLEQGAALLIDGQTVRFVFSKPHFESLQLAEVKSLPVFEHLQETQGIMIVPDVSTEKSLGGLTELFLKPRETQSLLIIPLLSATTVLGWLLLESKQIRRFSPDEIELARTITNQAAVAVQNARLLAETRSLTEDLERRVQERTAEMMREHHNSQTLLRITTELSASLDITQVLQRTLGVLNESMQAQSSLIILAQSDQMYHAGEKTFQLDSEGILPSTAPEKIIARWVMRERAATIVDYAAEDKRWTFENVDSLIFKSALGVPLKLGEELLGTLLLTHQDKNYFMIDQVNLVEAVAKQISVALNNAELFNLIRDQAENLGNMLRDQQIESSRSRAILEAVADGVLVTDANNKINLLNQSASEILGLKPKSVYGKNLEDFSGVFGSAANEWMSTIRLWTQDPTAYIFGDTYAEQVTLDNDRIISVHLAPVIWRTDFLGTVSVFRDITTEVQVDRMKSEFITNVSHELRTPLTAIKGYADIMLMGASGTVNDQQKHFLDIIRTNTIRLGVLVNDILDVSQIETGRMELNLKAVDLVYTAEEVIRKTKERSVGEEKPMTFTLHAPESLPKIKGDPDRILQIINNLVNNAYTYTPENGAIQVFMEQKDQFIQVDVIDNGIGIAEDIRDRVYERFYRGEDPLVLASAGTGLGLAVAKTLVEMHNGQIWFESSGIPGEGSVFSITLPVYISEE